MYHAGKTRHYELERTGVYADDCADARALSVCCSGCATSVFLRQQRAKQRAGQLVQATPAHRPRCQQPAVWEHQCKLRFNAAPFERLLLRKVMRHLPQVWVYAECLI